MISARFFGFAVFVAVALLSPSARSESLKSLYSFYFNGMNGAEPEAAMLDVGGILYGTTATGGLYGNLSNWPSGGTIFKFNPKTQVATVLHNFGNGSDGVLPRSALINYGGVLYGTTVFGGKHALGTLFSIDPATGVEKVLHSFAGGNDGQSPTAAMVNVGGVLYGTTSQGGIGQNGDEGGTIFTFDPKTGVEAVVYSFQAVERGTYSPGSALIDVAGMLYGTTEAGGLYGGSGTVFSFNPKTRKLNVLHSFGEGQDGADPFSALINVGGTLYGTTAAGGKSGNGTVYKVVLATGVETVVHTFGGGKDGNFPFAGLLNVGNVLYGTTQGYGNLEGFGYCPNSSVCGPGAVFEIDLSTTSYAEKVYPFTNIPYPGVAWPWGTLINVGGVFYGSTQYGGQGVGFLFSFTP